MYSSIAILYTVTHHVVIFIHLVVLVAALEYWDPPGDVWNAVLLPDALGTSTSDLES